MLKNYYRGNVIFRQIARIRQNLKDGYSWAAIYRLEKVRRFQIKNGPFSPDF